MVVMLPVSQPIQCVLLLHRLRFVVISIETVSRLCVSCSESITLLTATKSNQNVSMNGDVVGLTIWVMLSYLAGIGQPATRRAKTVNRAETVTGQSVVDLF